MHRSSDLRLRGRDKAKLKIVVRTKARHAHNIMTLTQCVHFAFGQAHTNAVMTKSDFHRSVRSIERAMCRALFSSHHSKEKDGRLLR
jgi:hypothetical protein